MSIVYSGLRIDNEISGSGNPTRKAVRVATVSAGTLSTDFENGDILDGIALVTNDRILIKNQTIGSENGIYIVQASGAPLRSDDYQEGDTGGGITVFVQEGTIQEDTGWFCINDDGSDIIGTNDLVYQQISGTGVDGNMNGPGSSTNNALVRWNGTAGTDVLDSGITLDGSNNMSGFNTIVFETGANDVTITATTQTVGAGTLNIPNLASVTTDIVGLSLTQTLTNKTLSTGSTWSGNTIGVANGGTGNASFTVGNVLVGNGTSAISATKAAPSGNFVGTTDVQTLTNKTLTTPIISQISNTGTLTLPTTTTTLVGTNTTNTLTNKTISSASNTITLSASTITSGTLPVARGGTGATTFTSGNFLQGNGTAAVTALKAVPTGVVVGTTDTQTLTNKTLTTPTIAQILNTGTLTLPTATTTLIGTNTSDTLTNKTINSASNTITLSASTITSGILPVVRGGTGANTFTTGNVLIGNGTSAITATKPAPTGNFVGTTDTQTLTNKTINSPIINQITTDSTEEILIFVDAGASVNEFTITNATTGNNPQLSATGNDANIGIDFQTKGTGVYRFLGTSTSHAEVRLFEDTDNGTNYTAWAAPVAISTTTTLRMPDGVGTSGQFLQTDGNNPATLAWANANITSLSATSTATTSTTSNTYVIINTMTITPAAGTYLVMFSSSGEVSATNSNGLYAIFSAGSIVSHSVRRYNANFFTNDLLERALHSQAITTVNGSQDIDVRYQVDAGSFTIYQRSLILIKLS